MGLKTLAQMNAELTRRITSLSSADANAALNRAVQFINRQGSFSFQLASQTTFSTDGTTNVNTPNDLDPGKAMYLQNANGSPIQRIPISDAWMTQNYNTYADAGFSGFILIVAPAAPHQFRLYPSVSAAQTVTLIYHKVVANITSGVTNLPQDFDDLVIDLAEAEERRIFDIGNAWPALLSRSMEQIKALLEGYRTQKAEAGTDSENAALVQSQTKVGKG